MLIKMKILWILFLAINLPSDNIQATELQLRDIGKTIGYYFEGRRNADIDLLNSAFSNRARLLTTSSKQQVLIISLQEYISVVSQKGKVTVKTSIDNIQLEHNMAIAKVRFDYENISYTDFLTLLNIQGQWKIVNKTFTINR